MPTREFTVTNKLGIHARPAAQFVKTASAFSCEIQVEKDDEQADGKSIMGLMMLAAGHGSILIITTEGCLLYTSPSPRDKIHDLVWRLLL